MLVGGSAVLGVAVAASVAGWLLLAVVPRQHLLAELAWLVTIVTGVTSAHLLTRQHRLRARRVAFGWLVGGSIVLGVLPYALIDSATATHTRLRYELRRISLPAGVSVVSITESGDRRCQQGCPDVVATLALPAGVPAATAEDYLDAVLYRAGYRYPAIAPGTLYRDGIKIELTLPGTGTAQLRFIQESALGIRLDGKPMAERRRGGR